MDVIIFGIIMILISMASATALAVVSAFHMFLEDIIEAIASRKVRTLVIVTFICSFIIGIIFVLVGSVY